MPVSEAAFERLRWVDPLTGRPLEPLIGARTPAGGPLCGALRVSGTSCGYPIVDCVARLTPELAQRHREWLPPLGLVPPPGGGAAGGFQDTATVDSFGFQWSWNAEMRSDADLRWRVAERFRIDPERFRGQLVLDAGSGAGDQSRWLLERGAQVVSIDLSAAIDVVARKLRGDARWAGVQGDITALPFADSQFDFVYCEGVIQHTRDSALTVRELCRVLRPGGTILATHYARPNRVLSRIKARYVLALRKRLQRWDRYKLLLLTGNLAALGYLPVLGRLVRQSGTAVHSDRMPDFKTGWTNTFDNYGTHAYQRYVSDDEFWGYFERAGRLEKAYCEGTVIAARRVD
jgi:ubiquinone/menaquinone biosynthesis C-methylase UbiE